MEKLCEFCRVLRPLVYCQADAAQLCLCCDAKVHSANALSNRHSRSLLCYSCRFRPASFHCSSSSDHNIYTCCSCDKALHTTRALAQHQRQPIHSYTGCPSVKEFAALWELDLNQLIRDHHVSAAHSSPPPLTNNIKILGRKQQPTTFLVQQIMELKKLQLNEDEDEDGSTNDGCYSSPFKLDNKAISSSCSPSSLTTINNAAATIRRKKVIEETSSIDNIARLHDKFHPNLVKKHPLLEDQDDLPFPATPFTLESLQSSSMVVEGDSFWQCRVQTNHNQFSAQNMQDLGVCEDLSRGDFNIPDVDVTFQNYEQLFGGGDNNDMSSSPHIIRGLEEEDAAYCNNNMTSATSDHFGLSSAQFVDSAGSCCLFPSYSISQDHHFHDDEVNLGQDSTKEDATKSYQDKKKARLHEKKTMHASVSPSVENADVRKRVVEGEVRMQRFRYH